MSRLLITIGILFILAGLLWPLLVKMQLGHLPGDIIIRRKNFHFYFPLATSVVISILLSLIFWLLKK